MEKKKIPTRYNPLILATRLREGDPIPTQLRAPALHVTNQSCFFFVEVVIASRRRARAYLQLRILPATTTTVEEREN